MTTPLSQRERFALGQAQRKHMRRTDHAGWQPEARRVDPLRLLAASMRGRVPALVPIKYERMLFSAFGFFRGAVPIMACDLSLSANTEIHAQICGDAHVRNLGAFAAPDGRLVFDINDFDETIRGPFEWDVKRMAVSLLLAGREAGAKNSLCREAVAAFLGHYRAMMHRFAQMPVLELAHYQVHRLHTVAPIAEILHLAERATPLHNLDALTIPVEEASATPASTELAPAGSHARSFKARVFKTAPPILTRVDGELAREVLDSLATYAESLQPERRHFLAQYTPLDVAFKIVGTGSVGLRDYCIYMQGNSDNDPLFLQIKEEPASAYAPYLGQSPAESHQGRRVVEGQRAMQFVSDPFLGWTTIAGRDFLVRQLNDHKASIELDELKSASLIEYATVCGETLARGHARSGDPCVIAGYIGTSARFDESIEKFSAAYAGQSEQDWQTLVRAHKGGKLGVEPSAAAKSKKRAANKTTTKAKHSRTTKP
jgi:uncharacterized protein (DUF2252 family)